MDALMLILIGMVIVVCFIFGTYTTLYNKLQDYVIRIDEVESIIDNNLREKYDALNKSISLIRGNEKISHEMDEKMFEEIVRLRTKKISNFDLDRKLIEANNSFVALREKYKDILDSEEIVNIANKIDDIDENLVVNKEYYNRNISEYNKLVKMFPTNIVAKLCKYEEKLFFDRKDMSDDDYEDFKL